MSGAESLRGSTFVPLSIGEGLFVCLQGPGASESGVAVDVLTPLDRPHGVLQSYVGGVCDASGGLLEPVEFVFAEVGRLEGFRHLISPDDLVGRLGIQRSVVSARYVEGGRTAAGVLCAWAQVVGPLYYCRKKRAVFTGRSRLGGSVFSGVPDGEGRSAKGWTFVLWDAESGVGADAVVYKPSGGATPVGKGRTLEQLVMDQGEVVRHCECLGEEDADAYAALKSAHACCGCEERGRCYPGEGGYAYALDRLQVVHGTVIPAVVAPLGALRLREAARLIGGGEGLDAGEGESRADGFAAYRRDVVSRYREAGPALMTAGERDGRPLLEMARLKLSLFEGVLADLEEVWRATGLPHLCWTDDTVRVDWRGSRSVPGAGWGMSAVVRKGGLQPAYEGSWLPGDVHGLVYPPHFSEADLLPPEVVLASRGFDQMGRGGLFVESVERVETGWRGTFLLEDLGISPAQFCAADLLRVEGAGWRLVGNPYFGGKATSGVRLRGVVLGSVLDLSKGQELKDLRVWWYPRFGESVDLHGVGMLLIEALLGHDERGGRALREVALSERRELTTVCEAVAVEQREKRALGWVEDRCQSDSPDSLWSRRNVVARREERAVVALDALPLPLWHVVVAFCLRMVTNIEGFSYCGDRTRSVPRLRDGTPVIRSELSGLVALLDDHLFGRRQPGAWMSDHWKDDG